ncbi:MAG: 50S ribosomal protein L18 [Patescibacteria group bacterium]|nr:50S ribosomal protein L18 [Patescibacteria group bacterium]
MLKKQEKRIRRHRKVRSKIFGTLEIPRLCVFRSNKHIYCQAIDDEKGKTLVFARDREIDLKQIDKKTDKKNLRTGKVAIAYAVGKLLAEKAAQNNIKKVKFDRGGYKYHGRVKALADGARKNALEF